MNLMDIISATLILFSVFGGALILTAYASYKFRNRNKKSPAQSVHEIRNAQTYKPVYNNIFHEPVLRTEKQFAEYNIPINHQYNSFQNGRDNYYQNPSPYMYEMQDNNRRQNINTYSNNHLPSYRSRYTVLNEI